MKLIDHRIDKFYEDSKLFESIFGVEIPNNIDSRNSTHVIDKETTILGRYFKSNVLTWQETDVYLLIEKVKEFNSLSKKISVYGMMLSDSEKDDDRIISASFTVGFYEKELESELFKHKELKKLIYEGQNHSPSDSDFELWCRKRTIEKILALK